MIGLKKNQMIGKMIDQMDQLIEWMETTKIIIGSLDTVKVTIQLSDG